MNEDTSSTQLTLKTKYVVYDGQMCEQLWSTPLWISNFLRYTNYHLPTHNSDHNTIMLEFSFMILVTGIKKKAITNKVKRFEHIWLQDQECHKIVRETWNNSSGTTVLDLLRFSITYTSGVGKSLATLPTKLKLMRKT